MTKSRHRSEASSQSRTRRRSSGGCRDMDRCGKGSSSTSTRTGRSSQLPAGPPLDKLQGTLILLHDRGVAARSCSCYGLKSEGEHVMAQSTAARVQTGLKPESLGLVSVTMQAITHIAPAIAALFFTQFLVTLSGLTAPLAYTLGVVVVLMLGNTLIQFSRQLPSAGGYYTYVSRSLGARMGFPTSGMSIPYSPMAGGVVCGFFGFIAAGELKTSYGWDVPWLWWVSIIVFASLVAALQYRGLELSARTLLIPGGAEILIRLALAFPAFANPGPGGFSFSPFNPANIGVGSAFGLSGFTLAIVLAVQGLTGWEAAAPLAEETKDPKRNTPRSVLLSIIILGVFLVFTYWGIITGFGVDNVKGIISSPDLPGLALARRVWGGGWWFILIAFISSTLAVTLATANVSTRMWYSMGRNGAF